MDYEENFPNLLLGKLCHTTSPIRYKMIMDAGWILPNPYIPEEERWGGSQGPEFYPYVRFFRGVSLSDSEDFVAELYRKKYPLSSWMEFVPYRRKWEQAVWIEINRNAIIEIFISGEALLKRWKQEKAFHHNIMLITDAAQIGPIGFEVINCVYKCGADIKGFDHVI